MDEATFYAQFLLSDRDRVRFNRCWLDHRSVPDDLLALLRTHFSATQRTHNLERIRRRCEELKIRRLGLLDPGFPLARVEPMADPPGVLFLRGDATLLMHTPSVGIVGSRRGTERARRVARSMGAEIGQAGVAVNSGMAMGVDGASHVGCLDAGGKAVAWLAGGVENISPPRHRALYSRLRANGLLASEYPPGTTVRRHHFVARNRLIAAFSDALVVVEAGERSGTRSTVEFCLDLGRDLFCVPGPVDCPHSSGTLRWLREGATLVRHAGDVLADMGLAPTGRVVQGVLGFGDRPESTVEVARRLGRELPEVAAALVRAASQGQLERLAGDRWCLPSALPRP